MKKKKERELFMLHDDDGDVIPSSHKRYGKMSNLTLRQDDI